MKSPKIHMYSIIYSLYQMTGGPFKYVHLIYFQVLIHGRTCDAPVSDNLLGVFCRHVGSEYCLWERKKTERGTDSEFFCQLSFVFMPLRPRPAGGIEIWVVRLCVRLYVHPSIGQVNIFVQGRISRPIDDSKLIFHVMMYLYETSRNIQEPICHGPLTSDFGQIIRVKIFVQGRILSSTNGSKLIFHMRMYLYETSRNVQEPRPHDLYFTVS